MKQRVPEILRKHRGKSITLGIGLFLVLAFVLYLFLSRADPEPESLAPPDLSRVVVVDELLHDVYLFGVFLEELGECYVATGQPQSLAELERAVGREWGLAVEALMLQYREDTCPEPEPYRRIPGRAVWLLDQVKALDGEPGEE